jgi:hypothetical protein
MTEMLTESDRRILRRYGASTRMEGARPAVQIMDEAVIENPVREAERRWKAAADLAYQMDFMRRFSMGWKPSVRVRPETLVAMQDAAASSTSVRGMNEPLPPHLNRAARRALARKRKR